MKMILAKCSFLVLFFLIAAPHSASATEIFGDVSGVLGPENNPYVVIADVRVPPGQSLEIRPGCYIEFAGHYRFIIDSLATFIAIGTESDSIVFTAQNRNTGWNGLRMYWPDSISAISYCRFEWGRGASHDQYPDYTRALGGAIYIQGGKLAIDNSILLHNRAWEGYGGAIYALQTSLSIKESVLEYNLAGFGGSAIFTDSSIINISQNTIYMDSTFYLFGGEDGGGAIGCRNSDVIIRYNNISNNMCGWAGAGLSISGLSAEVADNLIYNNEAWYYGGGISIGGTATITRNLICNNQVTYGTGCAGGGIACGDGTDLINNTIVGNYSYFAGGGIRYWSGVIPDTFANNIIWGNDAYSHDPQIYLWDGSPSPTMLYNDIQGGWAGEGNINSDPLFFGPDDFHISWANYPWEDSTKSPCIDTGDPSSPPDSDGTRADMGAFPFDPDYQDIIDDIEPLPNAFSLSQNYPNPFNAQTTISFDLPQTGLVSLSIYDITGRRIATPLNSVMPAGTHKYIWDAKDFSSGIYFAKLEFDGRQSAIRMILLK